MKNLDLNFDLNVGGLIGALGCGAIAAAIVLPLVEVGSNSRGPYKVIFAALFGGAIAGNFLWGMMYKKPKQRLNRPVPNKPKTGSAVAQNDPMRGDSVRRKQHTEVDDTDGNFEGRPRSGRR